jgi:hypothetical protein
VRLTCNYRFGHQVRWVKSFADWQSVLAQMTDEELEDELFTYFWLAMNTPNSHSHRLRDLVDEAERRGLAAMVERAKLRAANIPAGITCSDDENDSAG